MNRRDAKRWYLGDGLGWWNFILFLSWFFLRGRCPRTPEVYRFGAIGMSLKDRRGKKPSAISFQLLAKDQSRAYH